MKVLSISDVQLPVVYSPHVARRFFDVDLIISCGDLPYYYQEFLISMLNVPLFFVRGNHDKEIEYTTAGIRKKPQGGIDLHCNVVHYQGLLLAGVEGSLRYRLGPYQYSQAEMWVFVLRLIPRLLLNQLRFGRYLDVFVTHAPPRGIHDRMDLTHTGIDAFRWFIQRFQPSYHYHGHIHVYRPDEVVITQAGKTQVINTFGYRRKTIVINSSKAI